MRGFLFDLDGTLVDTAIDMIESLRLLAAENGIDIKPDYNKYKELITYGSKAIVTSIFGHLNSDEIYKLQQRYLDIYQQNLSFGSCLFEGVETFLKHLNNKQIPWGIVTNKPAYLAKPLIDSLVTLKHCNVLVGGDTTQYSKPHPEPLNHAIKELKLDPKNSWYIGDAQSDITAAKAANMKSAVALWGYLSKDDLPQNWQADVLLEQAKDLHSLN